MQPPEGLRLFDAELYDPQGQCAILVRLWARDGEHALSRAQNLTAVDCALSPRVVQITPCRAGRWRQAA